jgi:hypothetical protein
VTRLHGALSIIVLPGCRPNPVRPFLDLEWLPSATKGELKFRREQQRVW